MIDIGFVYEYNEQYVWDDMPAPSIVIVAFVPHELSWINWLK